MSVEAGVAVAAEVVDPAALRRRGVRRSLEARNRLVGFLRIALPGLGVAAFLGIAGQIFIASLAPQFGLGHIHFSGDTVTVDTPSYSGVTPDGDVYRVSAQGAETSVTSLDVINLESALLELSRRDGVKMSARTNAASFSTMERRLAVPGTAAVFDNQGNSGTFADVLVDLPTQHLTVSGPVNLKLAEGATVSAQGLDYSPATGRWQFGRATLVIDDPTVTGSDKP